MSGDVRFEIPVACDMANDLRTVASGTDRIRDLIRQEPKIAERAATALAALDSAHNLLLDAGDQLRAVMDKIAGITPENDGYITWDGATIWSGSDTGADVYEQLVPKPPAAPAISPLPQAPTAPTGPVAAPTLFGPNGPTMEDVSQVMNNYGLCGLVAGVQSLVVANPAFIQTLVHDNGDGTYTVTLPGRAPIRVAHSEVFAPDGSTVWGRSENGTVWFPVLAHALVTNVLPGQDMVPDDGVNSPWAPRAGNPNPVNPAVVIDLVGGTTGTFWAGNNGANSATVTNAFHAGKPVVVSFSYPGVGQQQMGPHGVYAGHAYSVVSINGDGTITLYNAWGYDTINHQGDGYVTIPISLLDSNLGGMSIPQ